MTYRLDLRHPAPLLRDWRTSLFLAFAVATAVALLLSWDRDGSDVPPVPEATGFEVSPAGNEVPRLTPVRVTFEAPPAERDGAAILSIEPPVEGTYEWISERTLLFQPAFPGYLRGQEYSLVVAAQPDALLSEDYRVSFVTEGLLTVQSVVPGPGDTEVPKEAQVLVQFSRSVAPLTLLSAQLDDPIVEFDPPLAGSGEWLNTSLYRFTPDEIAPSTTYTARIAAGLTSAADGVLQEDYSWSFSSYGPALDGTVPETGAVHASLFQAVTVYFNQAMDRASVEAGIRVERSSDEATVPGSFAWNAESTSVTFTPAVRLDHLTTYRAEIAEGLESVTGHGTTAGRTVTFTTVGLPGVAGTSPANGDTQSHRYGITISFSNPMDTESLEGKVSVTGFTEAEVESNWYFWDDLNLNLSLVLQPSTSYTVSIAAGATDRYGQPLPPYSFSFRTGRMEPFLSFATPGQVAAYMAGNEPILYFHSANYTSATFTLYPLTRKEARYLQVRNWIPNDPRGEDFNPSLPPLRSWTETWVAAENEVQLNSTSLSGGGPMPEGDYFVTTPAGAELAFAVVDTAIILKEGSDELLAWAVDIATGEPVSGVTITADGEAITGGHDKSTDSAGVARFGLQALTQPYQGRGIERGVVTIRGGNRYGVATMNWQQGFSTYQMDIPTEYYFNRKYVGHIYTDRPIYRPGEMLHLKGVVRSDDDAAYSVPPSDAPIKYSIIDAQGTVVDQGPAQLNEFGSFAIDFELPPNADTGSYGVQLTWNVGYPYGEIPLSGSGFIVAEFRVPEFEVDLTTAEPSYASGDEIAASLSAEFFFGGAVQGAVVEWAAIADPFSPSWEEYPGFWFGDHDRYFRRLLPPEQNVFSESIRASGTVTTGEDGKAAFSVPATIVGEEGPQQYTISASVRDESGQVVAGNVVVPVHPADGYAGIRTGSWVAAQGEETSLDIVTVDTDGQPNPNQDVEIRIYERTWVTTKEVTPEGARRYRSDPIDTLVETIPAHTGASAEATVSFTPENPGTLRIVAEYRDSSGRVARSSTFLWVYGGGMASWYVGNDDGLALVPDKESYEVGDTAQVLVPAPFEGSRALVTVERGKVHSAETISLPTNSATLSIPIEERSVPNVFVSAVLYRPPTDADPLPRYKVGYAQLPVSTDTRVLNVDIQPDRVQAAPGDTVGYDIRVTDSRGRGVRAEVSVAVVDKAVLSLAEERSTTGLLAFWFERGLGVLTASTLASLIDRTNDVITEPRQGGKGGGGFDADVLRSEFKNTAFWEAQLVTNEDGTLHVNVALPDNLTTWRMQVRAISTGALVGEGTNELLSTVPLLLRPALPRFLRVGDEVTLRVLARNATDEPLDVSVSLEAEGIDVDTDESRVATIRPGQSVPFEWPASVTTDGGASLTFRATSDGPGDAVVQNLPVWLDVTAETTATGGIVKEEALSEALYLPEYAILEGGGLDVKVEASLTGLLAGELGAFAPPIQPYDRWESSTDIAARIIATVAVLRAEDSAGLPPARNARIRTDLAELLARQATDGGWLWVPTNTISSPWVTGWALAALGEAQEAGFEVDSERITRARFYVSSYLNRSFDVKYPPAPDERAFFAWALAVAGAEDVALPLAKSLFETQRANLSVRGKAYTLLALSQSGEGRGSATVQALFNDISAAVIPSANGNHWESAEEPDDGARYHGRPSSDAVDTTAAVVLALVRTDPTHPLVEESVRWLVVSRGASGYRSGTEAAIGIDALSSFAVSTGELAGDFSFSVTADGKSVLSGRATAADGAVRETSLDLADFEKGGVTVFEFARDFTSPGRLYYRLNLHYFTPAREVEALNRGLAVAHEYTDLDDPETPITSARVGDVVRVTVTVMAPAERNYVEVEDFLPAGLEPIDPNLANEDAILKRQLAVERVQAADVDTGGWWAPWYWWYYTPFEEVSIRDDRVVMRATVLPKGVHTYVYYARATVPGDFFVAPAHAEEARFPEVFGRGDSGRFIVEP
jgi:uncharacterized protein YfaS (alpha-2-macroglobulin family)